jgi:bacterioferritin-associated ferredoxin
MYVCLCRGITTSDVKEVARGGAASARDFIEALGLEDEKCCGLCVRNIDRILAIAGEVIPIEPVTPAEEVMHAS